MVLRREEEGGCGNAINVHWERGVIVIGQLPCALGSWSLGLMHIAVFDFS